jgi:zinc finger RNA-binding protein
VTHVVYPQVLKLHTKLGKPIPSADPVVMGAPAKTAAKPTVAVAGTATAVKAPAASNPAVVAGVKKVVATPKINFIGKR